MGKKGLRIGALIGMVACGYQVYKESSGQGIMAGKMAIRTLTGFDISTGKFDWKHAKAGLALGAGVGLSIIASKTGINRYTPKGINL